MDDPILRTKAFGLTFSNPIGLAAGFDKHAEAIPGLFWSGFGAVEIGSVTPQPQPGNEKPRVFRLTKDRAIINRYGFNSHGAAIVAERLSAFRSQAWHYYWPWLWPPMGGVLGINLGKNKDAPAISDYVQGVQRLGEFADYLVVNVSSPNTPNLRALQRRAELQKLAEAVLQERDALTARIGRRVPVLVKVSPDLSHEEMADIAAVALACKVDGLVVSNTTLKRPSSLRDSTQAIEVGGLSGEPLRELSTAVLSELYVLTEGKMPLIGVGGVSSGHDALEKIKHGASLVQLYTALVYEGPTLVPRIKRDLAALLRAEGYRSVSEAVGAAHRRANNTPL